jgi:very-short-patch-repair endonuclease
MARSQYCIRHRGGVLNERIKSKSEQAIMVWLDDQEIKCKINKVFDCGKKGKKYLYLDFYLPEWNAAIEFDGKQHFTSVKYFKGDEGLEERKRNDSYKDEWIHQNGISILRISYRKKEERAIPYVEAFIEKLRQGVRGMWCSDCGMYEDRPSFTPIEL